MNEPKRPRPELLTITRPADAGVWLATDFEDTWMGRLGPAAGALARRLARTPTAPENRVELCELARTLGLSSGKAWAALRRLDAWRLVTLTCDGTDDCVVAMPLADRQPPAQRRRADQASQ